MGKALLLLVFGSSLVLGKQLLSSHESENRSATDQRNYQENVLAREIATSAFNVGMGEIRAYGERLRDGVQTFNGTTNAGRTATITSGKYAGGKYTVRADMTSGHSVRITSDGYYGRYVDRDGREQWRGHVRLHDEYRVRVLTARERSIINVSFLESQAGYCSAVFLQVFTADTPAGQKPAPMLLFAPDNRDRGTSRPAREIIVNTGTQMNFFIGVDQNCSERPATMNSCQARTYASSYPFNYAHYRTDGTNAGTTSSGNGKFDYLHYALEVEAGSLDQATEAMWGVVEQNPANRNRWRIGWEDIHNTAWNLPTSSTPSASLQATKRLGYDGRGWPDSDALGYGLLRDYGSRPDFSDQVIEVTMTPTDTPAGQARITAERAALTACGLPVPEEFQPPPPTPDPTPTPTPDPTPTSDPTPTPTPTTPPPTDQNGSSCSCQGNKNVYLFHRPPGNQSNVRRICISENGLNGHRNHNDYVICRGT